MREFHATVVVCAFFSWILATSGRAQAPSGDWPQWRGPHRDAVARHVIPPEIWPDRLVSRWTAEVGLGYATPIIAGDRVFVFARQGETESLAAFDAATGREIWRTGYPAEFTMNSGAARHGPGPKSTPAFADGRVFAIGMTGAISAVEAATGRVLWRKPAGRVAPMFTTHAFSPLIDGDLVVFHVGGHDEGALVAFDTATGDERWRWAGDGPAYGSPVLAEIGGTRQIITLTQRKLVGVDAGTGALLWERPYTTPSVTNAQTPNVLGNLVILGDSGHPVQAFEVARHDGRWSADVAWENDAVRMELSSAVVVRDMLVGLSVRNAGQYFALDAKTGRTLWTSPPRQTPQAALTAVGDVVFSLESDGELVLMRASATAFEPVRRYRVSSTATWAAPALSGTRIFVKDVDTLALWTWDAASPAGLPAGPPTPGGVSPDTLLRADILFWESVKDATNPALFEAYLRQFPNGTFRALAEVRLEELRAGRKPHDPGRDAAHGAANEPRWASIPAGRFQMGCVPGDGDCRTDEKPRHAVDVRAFQMMTTPVTVAMYRTYAAERDRPMPHQPDWNSRADHPVIAVSWSQAVEFCRAIDARLPSEAEFEYAARGGVDGMIYVWGRGPQPTLQGRPAANLADESARRVEPGWTDVTAGYDDGFARTSPVATFPPNGFGLFDMAGNVWQWTSSRDLPYPHRAGDGRDDPASRDRRALRGGSWTTTLRGMRLSYRVMDDPHDEDDNHGFRCAK